MGRIVIGVIVGFVVWSVMWVAAGAVAKGVFADSISEDGAISDPVALVTVLFLSMACSLVSGAVAGIIAPLAVRKTAMTLGLLLLVVGIAVQVSGWDKLPVWYHVLFLGLLVPMTLRGATLTSRSAPLAQNIAPID
ncbi:MAG: hypothetical protein ACPGXK_04680 [Phycisphaerae bacterium]